MHTVELLHQALAAAEAMGVGVRHEWLGGSTGGICEIGGKPWLFVDLALNPIEQLDQVVEALRELPHFQQMRLPTELDQHLGHRRAA